MGDARLDYDEIVYGWFDHFLKGENGRVLDKLPKVTLLHDGHATMAHLGDAGRPGAQTMTFYLASGGKANTLYGDGALVAASPASTSPTRSPTTR